VDIVAVSALNCNLGLDKFKSGFTLDWNMKFWLAFGLGLMTGAAMGAVLVSYLLYDDVTQGSGRSTPAMASVKKPPVHARQVEKAVVPAPPATAPSVASSGTLPTAAPSRETKPAALAAEAVDLDSLPSVEEKPGVIATARREDATDTPTAR
jgi:hypothetical protein